MAIENKKMRFNLATFDLAKGTAMILIVFSHIYGHYDLTQSKILSAIPYFMQIVGTGILTAFFIITGFGFKALSLKKILKKTFKDLIIPYLWITAAYALIFPLVRYPFVGSWSEVVTQAMKFVAAFLLGYVRYGKVVFGVQIFWCTAAWFLLATFIAINILNLILKIEKIHVQIICVILCVIIGNLLFSLEFFYFCIPQGIRSVGYLYLGYMIKKKNVFRYMQSSMYTYLILIPIYLLEMKFVTLSDTMFLNVLMEYLGSIAAALLLIFVCVYIGEKDWKATDWVKSVGVYSYWIICIHSIEMEMIPWYLNAQYFSQNQLLAFLIEIVIKVIVITAGCIILKKISQIKYRKKRVMIGK